MSVAFPSPGHHPATFVTTGEQLAAPAENALKTSTIPESKHKSARFLQSETAFAGLVIEPTSY